MEKIRLYHIDAKEEAFEIVKKYLAPLNSIHLIGQARSPTEAKEEIGRIFPDVVLIDENIAPGKLPLYIQELLLHSPYLGILVSTSEHGIVKIKQFMNAGARDCLLKPYNASDLEKSILQVHSYVKQLKSQIVKNSTKILLRAPQMISVFSTKGGVGKSTISTLLASGLAYVFRENTVILDLDLQFGDVSLLMDVKPKSTISTVIENIDRLDSADLKKILFKHRMGVYILPSPLKPEEADFITEAGLSKLFSLLREEFDYIIVDTPPGFTDQSVIALEQSDCIFFVTSPELISLKNTKTGLKTLKELGVEPEKIKLVVNRYSPKNTFPLSLIEETLDIPIYSTVSNDYFSVIQFLNQGQPESIYLSKGKVGKDLKKMIEGLRNYHVINQKQNKKFWFWPFNK